MIVETDVKCLHCGRVSWRVQCEGGACPRTAVQVWPELLKPLPARPRCQHCGGPVYLDEDARRLHLTAAEWRAWLRRGTAHPEPASVAPPKRRPAPAPASVRRLVRAA